MMIYRTNPAAQRGVGPDCSCDVILRLPHCFDKSLAFRQSSRDRCRVRASSAMRMGRIDPPGRKLVEIFAGRKKIHGIAFQVPTFHQDISRTQFQKSFSGSLHVIQRDNS